MEGPEAIDALLDANADRDVIVINHRVSRDLHYKLSRVLQNSAASKNCTVFLTTRGGDPNGGYRVARCLRNHYEHVRLVVPSRCKSAGTLIAIAANEVVIGDLGELGPLDIQVKKGSELEENSSGLDIQQALQAVTKHAQDAFYRLMLSTREFGLSTRLCAEFAATVTSGIVHPLMSQIDPLRVGEMQRATRVALEYGERLNAHSSNLKHNALERLIGAYPAHGFVIDRKEASELFKEVGKPSKEEGDLIDAFWDLLSAEDISKIFFLNRPTPEPRDEHDDASGPPEGSEDQVPGEDQELYDGIGQLLAYSKAPVG
ncbi:TPA: hypothetical protein UMT86_000907 [Stenotrophomonas maltophilia]|nr:hypothetical protein [Stenotrophomonas maltophilia]